MGVAISSSNAFAQELKPIFDARLTLSPAKISAAEEQIMKTRVLPAAKKLWEGEICDSGYRPIDIASGSFTKPGSKQKAILYQFCEYGHNFARNGIAVIEGDKIVAHVVYEGAWDNAIGALPDINGNGLSEILISTGGTNQGETWSYVSIIELSGNTIRKFGTASVLSDTCGKDEKTGNITGVKLLVKTGAKPFFYKETFIQKDCAGDKWTMSKGRMPVALEKSEIVYRYIK